MKHFERLIYAIGDVHGRLDLAKQLFDKIKQHAKFHMEDHNELEIVFLGDYVDRGPDSKGVIDFVIGLQQDYKVIALKGNHEDMFIKALEKTYERGIFESNGGKATLKSYAGHTGSSAYQEVNKEHIDWLKALPVSYETDKHIFVHAGMLPKRPLHEQFDNHLMWVREPFLECSEMFFNHDMNGHEVTKHVIHGHTPWEYDHHRESRLKIRTNLDSGAFFSNVLTCAVVDPNVDTPIEFIQAQIGDMEDDGMECLNGVWLPK